MSASSRPAKKVLTDTLIRSLKPAATGTRYAVADALVPGFVVRVTEHGAKTYMVVGRWGGSAKPAALAIGKVGAVPLVAARAKAREWLEVRARGDDPRAVERKRLAAEREREGSTFAVVCETYIKRVVALRRHGKADEQTIRRELLSRWKGRALSAVTRRDVVEMIDAIVDRGAPTQARHVFGHLRALYNWAITRGIYGIEASPTDRLRPAALIGKRVSRDRVLDDAEIAAFWHVADRKLGYPFGPLFRLLLLTGQRKSEIGNARWSEIDLKAKTLTIDAARYKTGIAHVVPLCDDALAILDGLPRFDGSDLLFSFDGERPVTSYYEAKPRVDRLMAEELGYAPPPFVLHDLRRTTRTRLAALRIPSEVAELVIGHTKKGIQAVYDRHAYADEKRNALAAWAVLLRTIVEPPVAPSNVVSMRAMGDGKA